jgi:SAM-dependent methyltransferase
MDEAERLARVYRGYERDPAVYVRWSETNAGNRWIAEERRRAIVTLLQSHGFLPLQDKRVLDIGCGRGAVLASLTHLAARPCNLYGIDLLPDRIEAARQAYPGICFICGNAESLDFPDAHFDLVFLFTVFSSILDDRMAGNVANEVRRVLKPGGAVLWYNFRYNNPYNPHVRGMTKRHIRQFFPGFEMHLRTITLLPPLARRLGRLTPVLYPLLVAIPPLRTHYLGLLIRPQTTDRRQRTTDGELVPDYSLT